jgi:AcrR family transcriptional regulator
VHKERAAGYRSAVAKGDQTGEGDEDLRRLPPGRHGLPRDFVVQNQRERLTAAMISVVARLGFHEATVSAIADAAGVSRRTFYEHFPSKEACFGETYRLISTHLRGEMEAAAEGIQGREGERLRAALASLLETFSANPDLVRFLLIAPRTGGEPITGCYVEFLDELYACLVDSFDSPEHQPSKAVQHALIGGLATLLIRAVNRGEDANLSDLLPDLTELLLTPYLGRDAATLTARGS